MSKWWEQPQPEQPQSSNRLPALGAPPTAEPPPLEPWMSEFIASRPAANAVKPDAKLPAMDAPPTPGILSDIGNQLKRGYAGTAQGVNWLGSVTPGLKDIPVLDWQGNADYWRDQAAQAGRALSPEQQAADKKKFLNDDYTLGDAWGDVRSYTGPAIESIPGTVAGMAIGGPIAAGLKRIGGAIFPSLTTKGAERLAMGAGAIGYGTGEGVVSAGSAGAQARELVFENRDLVEKSSPLFRDLLDQGHSKDDALRMVADTAAQQIATRSGLTVGLLGAPMGAVFGKWFHGAGGERIGKTALGAIGIGAGGEALQEMPQSGFEQFYQNQAMRDYVNPEQALLAGVPDAMVKGGIAGGLMGGAMGTAGHFAQGQPVPQALPSPPEALPADPAEALPTDAAPLPTPGGIIPTGLPTDSTDPYGDWIRQQGEQQDYLNQQAAPVPILDDAFGEPAADPIADELTRLGFPPPPRQAQAQPPVPTPGLPTPPSAAPIVPVPPRVQREAERAALNNEVAQLNQNPLPAPRQVQRGESVVVAPAAPVPNVQGQLDQFLGQNDQGLLSGQLELARLLGGLPPLPSAPGQPSSPVEQDLNALLSRDASSAVAPGPTLTQGALPPMGAPVPTPAPVVDERNNAQTPPNNAQVAQNNAQEPDDSGKVAQSPAETAPDLEALQTHVQMYEDAIGMRRETGQPVPQEWIDNYAAARQALRGTQGMEEAGISPLVVPGHPEHPLTDSSPLLRYGTVPLKVTSADQVQRRLFEAQKALSDAQGQYSLAEYQQKIAKNAVDKRKAANTLRDLNNKGITPDALDALRNETIPELNRLFREMEQRQPNTPTPAATVSATQPLPEITDDQRSPQAETETLLNAGTPPAGNSTEAGMQKEPWQMRRTDYAATQSLPADPRDQAFEKLRNRKTVEQRNPGIYFVPANVATPVLRRSLMTPQEQQSSIGRVTRTNRFEWKQWGEVTGDYNSADASGYALIDRAEQRRVDGDRYHRTAVEKALNEGKPVPAEVLADYPDLKTKAAPPTNRRTADAKRDYIDALPPDQKPQAIERARFQSHADERIAQDTETFQGWGASPEDAAAKAAQMADRVRDNLTGFDNKEARDATLERAITHMGTSKDRGFYVEADLRNLGGLNHTFGATGANAHFRAFTDIFAAEMRAIADTDVSLFRHGGDEFAAVIVGNATPEQVQAAIAAAERKVAEYVTEQGMADIPHPKHKGDATFNGTGITAAFGEITKADTVKKITSDVDQEIERKKGQRDVNRIETQTTGPVASTRPAGSTQQGTGEAVGQEPEGTGNRRREGAEGESRDADVKPADRWLALSIPERAALLQAAGIKFDDIYAMAKRRWPLISKTAKAFVQQQWATGEAVPEAAPIALVSRQTTDGETVWLAANEVADTERNVLQLYQQDGTPLRNEVIARDDVAELSNNTDEVLADYPDLAKRAEPADLALDEFEAAGYRPADVTRSQWVDMMRRHRRSLGQPEDSDNPYNPNSEYEVYWEGDKKRQFEASEGYREANAYQAKIADAVNVAIDDRTLYNGVPSGLGGLHAEWGVLYETVLQKRIEEQVGQDDPAQERFLGTVEGHGNLKARRELEDRLKYSPRGTWALIKNGNEKIGETYWSYQVATGLGEVKNDYTTGRTTKPTFTEAMAALRGYETYLARKQVEQHREQQDHRDNATAFTVGQILKGFQIRTTDGVRSVLRAEVKAVDADTGVVDLEVTMRGKKGKYTTSIAAATLMRKVADQVTPKTNPAQDTPPASDAAVQGTSTAKNLATKPTSLPEQEAPTTPLAAFIASRPIGLQKSITKTLQGGVDGMDGFTRADLIQQAIENGATVQTGKSGRTLGALTEKQLTKYGMDYAEYLAGGKDVAPVAQENKAPAGQPDTAVIASTKHGVSIEIKPGPLFMQIRVMRDGSDRGQLESFNRGDQVQERNAVNGDVNYLRTEAALRFLSALESRGIQFKKAQRQQIIDQFRGDESHVARAATSVADATPWTEGATATLAPEHITPDGETEPVTAAVIEESLQESARTLTPGSEKQKEIAQNLKATLAQVDAAIKTAFKDDAELKEAIKGATTKDELTHNAQQATQRIPAIKGRIASLIVRELESLKRHYNRLTEQVDSRKKMGIAPLPEDQQATLDRFQLVSFLEEKARKRTDKTPAALTAFFDEHRAEIELLLNFSSEGSVKELATELRDLGKTEAAIAAKDAQWETASDTLTMITIDVPGDGSFRIANTKPALKAFRDKLEKSAAFNAKGVKDEVSKPQKPSLKSTPASEAIIALTADKDGLASDNTANAWNLALANDVPVIVSPSGKFESKEWGKDLSGNKPILYVDARPLDKAEFPEFASMNAVIARRGTIADGRGWDLIDADTGRLIHRGEKTAEAAIADYKERSRSKPISPERAANALRVKVQESAEKLGVEATPQAVNAAINERMQAWADAVQDYTAPTKNKPVAKEVEPIDTESLDYKLGRQASKLSDDAKERIRNATSVAEAMAIVKEAKGQIAALAEKGLSQADISEYQDDLNHSALKTGPLRFIEAARTLTDYFASPTARNYVWAMVDNGESGTGTRVLTWIATNQKSATQTMEDSYSNHEGARLEKITREQWAKMNAPGVEKAAEAKPESVADTSTTNTLTPTQTAAIAMIVKDLRGDVYNLAGDQNRQKRVALHNQLLDGTGQTAKAATSGVTALREKLLELAGISKTGKAPVQYLRELNEWMNAVVEGGKEAPTEAESDQSDAITLDQINPVIVERASLDRRYTLDELTDAATYNDDGKLATFARAVATGVAAITPGYRTGDLKREFLAGQHAPLMLAATEAVNDRQEGIRRKVQKNLDQAATLTPPAGYTVTTEGRNIILSGPFNQDLHERIKRAGGEWDGKAGGNRRVWIIPASKSAGLQRIFTNSAEAQAAQQAADAAQKAKDAESRRQQQEERQKQEAATAEQRKAAESASPSEQGATPPKRQARILFPVSAMPPLNTPVRMNGRNVVFTGVGKPFRIDENQPSMHGSHLLGYEGEMGRYVYLRPATEQEAQRLDSAVPTETTTPATQTADQLRQARKDGAIDTPTLIARLAAQVVSGEIPTGRLFTALQSFDDWSEGEVADALRKAGLPAEQLKAMGYEEGGTDQRFAQASTPSAAQQDADYLAAVNRGDMETAQRMVDAAADRAGYNSQSRAFHGSPSKGFLVFDPSKQGQKTNTKDAGLGFFFTHQDSNARPDEARRYAETSAYLDGELVGEVRAFYLKNENPGYYNHGGEYWRPDAFLKAVQQAKDEGRTGLIIEGVKSPFTNGVHHEEVVFNSNQIKSADPVTYDDAGTIIPLSQRFNRTKADVRYAQPSSTPSTLITNLKALSGDKLVQGLIDNGRLNLVARQSSLPPIAAIPPGQRVAGWVHPKTGAVYLIAENIAPGEIEGFLNHEVGVHQAQLWLNQPKPQALRLAHTLVRFVGAGQILGDNDFQDVLNQLQQLRARNVKAVVDAYAKAAKAMGALNQNDALLHEEALAYLVGEQRTLPLVKRIMAAIKAFLYRAGIKLSLNENDLHALAVSATKNAAARMDGFSGLAAAGAMGQNSEDIEAARQYAEVVAQYKGTPQWMKAPNGEPTKLNERQWVQTRTENFKRWFDGSQVVDENGDPLVAWHGTTSTRTVPGTQGQGDSTAKAKLQEWAAKIGIADWGDVASIFERLTQQGTNTQFGVTLAMAQEARSLTADARGRYTSPVEDIGFYKFRFPSDSYELGVHFGTRQQAEARGEPFAFFLSAKNSLRLPDLGNWEPKRVLDAIQKAGVEITTAERTKVMQAKQQAPALRRFLIGKGYDSIIYRNDAEGSGDSLIAFSTTQIKSATANTGAFSPTNPDIRYAQSLAATEPNLSPAELLKRIDAGGEVTAVQWQQIQEYLRAAAQPASTGNTLKAWFGASKITDKAGEPLKMYHGTAGKFNAFDAAYAGGSTTHPTAALGFFFTNDQEHAGKKYAGQGGNVLEVYLAVEKPYQMTDRDLMRIESLEDAAAFRKRLEAQGYDGVIMPQEVAGTRYVAAFFPDQVKLTSNETFTRGEKDMRFSYAGEKSTLVDDAAAYGITLTPNPDGTITLHHGASKENAVNIAKQKRFEERTYFSHSLDVTGYQDEPPSYYATVKNKGGRVISARIDPSAVEFVSGTGEFYAPEGLAQGKDGVWRSPSAAAQSSGKKQKAPQSPVVQDVYGDQIQVAGTWYHAERLFGKPASTYQVGDSVPELAQQSSQRFAAANPALPTRTYTAEQQAAMEKIGRKPPQTWASRWADFTDRFGLKMRQAVADHHAALLELDQKAYGADVVENQTAVSSWVKARLSRSVDGPMHLLLHETSIKMDADGAIDVAGGKGLKQILEPLGAEVDDFFKWVAGNRAAQLKQEDRENLFTDADIAALKDLNKGAMADGKARVAVYGQALREFAALQKSVMDIAEQAGLIDGSSRPIWEQAFYVPFYRIAEDAQDSRSVNAGDGLTRQEAFKKLKGGKDRLNDLLENTILNWNHLLSASLKNNAARQALKTAQRVEYDGVKVAEPINPNAESTKGAVYYREDGKEHWFRVNDPLVLEALTALEFSGIKGPVMTLLRRARHLLTRTVTISPAFKVANLLRDTVQTLAVSQASAKTGGIGNIVQGWRDYSADSAIRKSMLAGGGAFRFGTSLDGNAEALRKLLTQGVQPDTILDAPSKVWGVLRHAFEGYEAMGDRMENANRAALYDQLRKQNKSHLYASFQARDLMDFSQTGASGAVRFLTAVVPFLNARIQGLDKLGRAASSPAQRGRFALVVTAATLASAVLYLAYKDDDDFKRREEWDRDTYWWFKIGETAFRIPKPFEVGALATLMGDRVMEQIFDQEATAGLYLERLKHTLTQTFSIQPVPQLLVPMMNVYANRDPFTGRMIESMAQRRLSPELRQTGRTTDVARGVSAASGGTVSPIQADYLLAAYFGWLGRQATLLADYATRPLTDRALPEQLPIIGDLIQRFTPSDDPTNSKYLTRFYEVAKTAEQHYADIRELARRGDKDGAQLLLKRHLPELTRLKLYRSASQQLNDWNNQLRMIAGLPASTLTDEQRDTLRRTLQANKLKLARMLMEGQPAT